jgi:cleavage and polyadenylation specificity factor subunit 3
MDSLFFGPCVVMASPGFLQSGISRQLFEAWCDNDRNGVIIAGYTIEGTLAHDLLSMPLEVSILLCSSLFLFFFLLLTGEMS